MESNEEFLAAVDGWVTKHASSCANFGDLVMRLPGVYPSTVRQSLNRLAALGRMSDTERLIRSATKQHSSPPDVRRVSSGAMALPAPHPLDYDWRFSESACSLLLNRCAHATAETDSVVLIGTPSLLAEAIRFKFARNMTLLDKNRQLSAHFSASPATYRMVLCDVARDELPVVPARMVLIDPPWYHEHMRSFLWAASQMCAEGGSVVMSIPPMGTRPGIIQERAEVLAFAAHMGLDLASAEEGVLAYYSPPFEQAALAAEGLSVPVDWRRGDLVSFRKSTQEPVARPSPPPDEDGPWIEERLVNTHLRIRQTCDEVGFVTPCLQSLASDDVLSSVSRRDSRRRNVDVWTTRNRVFRVEGRGLLRCLVQAITARRDPEADARIYLGRTLVAEESECIRMAISQLLRLAEIESYDEAQ